MNDADTSVVLVERRGHVTVLTLNRPEVHNACNLAMWLAAGEALEEANDDPEVRAVIVTGAGDRTFSAGADLKAIMRGEPARPEDPVKASWGFAGIANHPIAKPVIAAVNGNAMGGGTELALGCDLVVAVDSARFGLSEVKVGLFAASGGVFRLGRQIPPKVAMEMILTGDPIDARRALELGLVNRVVPREQLMDTALGLAEKIAGNAPLSVQASKRLALRIIDGAFADEAEDWERSEQEMMALSKSEDAKEGPRAFAEKRPPQWKAR